MCNLDNETILNISLCYRIFKFHDKLGNISHLQIYAFLYDIHVGASPVVPPAAPVSHGRVNRDTTGSCSCGLVNKSVPVNASRPSQLFLTSKGRVSSSYTTRLCVDNCPPGGPVCVCIPTDFRSITLQELSGLHTVSRHIPQRCNSQCK